MYLTLLANFQIMLCLMKSSGCVPLLHILHKNLHSKTTIHVNELILTPFSPFYSKRKKISFKKLLEMYFWGDLGELVFHIFSRLH